MLDEHFRRSLGADYQALCKKKEDKKEPPKDLVKKDETSEKKKSEDAKNAIKAFQEDMDIEAEGYTGKYKVT